MLGFGRAQRGGRKDEGQRRARHRLFEVRSLPAPPAPVQPHSSPASASERRHRQLSAPQTLPLSREPSRLAHTTMAAAVVCVARPAGRQAPAPGGTPSHSHARPSVQARALSMPVPQPTFGTSGSYTAQAAAAFPEAGPSCPWPPAPQRRGIWAWLTQVRTREGRAGRSAGCRSGAALDSVPPARSPPLQPLAVSRSVWLVSGRSCAAPGKPPRCSPSVAASRPTHAGRPLAGERRTSGPAPRSRAAHALLRLAGRARRGAAAGLAALLALPGPLSAGPQAPRCRQRARRPAPPRPPHFCASAGSSSTAPPPLPS